MAARADPVIKQEHHNIIGGTRFAFLRVFHVIIILYRHVSIILLYFGGGYNDFVYKFTSKMRARAPYTADFL